MKGVPPVYHQVMIEQRQGHETRKNLFTEIQKELEGIPLISFATSFNFNNVMIEDSDVDMIEGILQKMNLRKGLALMVNSPGGLGLSAERIINICRAYSGTGDFLVLVPGKAKSAATMICMGASKIFMSKTSELGPIDPQLTIAQDKIPIAVWNIVQSYKELMERAEAAQGNLHPFLQQLTNYDPREIKQLEAEIALAEDVAIRALKSGMMKDVDTLEIKKKIKPFLTPEETKSHGRSIFYAEAKKCGLNVELMPVKSRLWQLSYELFVRTHNFTTTRVAKCVENENIAYAAGGNI